MPAPVTPTTQELADNIRSQIEASVSQTTPLLPKSFIRVLSFALAAVLVVLYKYANWFSLQIFPTTADAVDTQILGRTINPLLEWGTLVGVGAPLTGQAAELEFTIVVNTQTGSIPAQTQIVNPGSNVVYLTTSSVLLNAATVTVNAIASSDPNGGRGVGIIGNADNGTVMQFANPIANVQRNVTVASTITQGAEPETTDAYRERVLERFSGRPQGGAPADYVAWGKEVPGIVNIYPYRGQPGQAVIYVEATPASSGDPDGIPTGAQLTAVEDAVNFDTEGDRTRRPVSTYVLAEPITRTAFNVEVQGLVVSDVVTVQAQLLSELTDFFFLNREPFIVGVTPSPRTDVISTGAVIGLIEDVVTANGGYFSDATVALASAPGAPIDTYFLGEGEKAKLNIVSYS